MQHARPYVSLLSTLALGCSTPNAGVSEPEPAESVISCVTLDTHDDLAKVTADEGGLYVSVYRSYRYSELSRFALHGSVPGARERGEVPFMVQWLVGAADLDLDGHLDLIANGTDVIFGVDRPAAEWTFVSLAKGPTSQGGAADIGDIDADGRPELVAAVLVEHGTEIVVTRFDDARGHVQTVVGEDGWLVQDLSLGDADGDGHVDVSTIAYVRAPRPEEATIQGVEGPTFAEYSIGARLSLWPGDGTGMLAAPRSFDTNGDASDLMLADLDPGGALEYVWAIGHPKPEVQISSVATNELRTLASIPVSTHEVSISDIDQDGHLDLIATGNRTRFFHGGPFPTFEPWFEHVGAHRAGAAVAGGVLLVGRYRKGEVSWCTAVP